MFTEAIAVMMTAMQSVKGHHDDEMIHCCCFSVLEESRLLSTLLLELATDLSNATDGAAPHDHEIAPQTASNAILLASLHTSDQDSRRHAETCIHAITKPAFSSFLLEGGQLLTNLAGAQEVGDQHCEEESTK